ncbi:MAG TPA: hypothetical protein VK699_11725 [Terriglobales bacterium]|jgi:hypothetical protein|nr:hypothetical protein [Terriglobales bacterium]
MIEMQQSEKKSLRRYLLGEAAGEEQSQIEQRLLTDEDYFNELLRTEEELTDEYVRGELQQGEKENFELHFVNNPERREQVEFARDLNRYLSTQTIKPAVPSACDEPQPWGAWLPFALPGGRAAIGAVLCAMLLLATGSVLLWRETLQLRSQVQQVQAQRSQSEQHEQELMQQIDQELAQNNEFAVQFERQQSELAKLRRELTGLLYGESQHQADTNMVSLLLEPGLSRAPALTSNATLSSSTERLRLELEIGQEAYKSYHAEVQTVEGSVVSSQEDLKAHKTGHNRTVTVVLPTALISRSDYLVMLDGISAGGASEKIGTYYFKVVRK